MGKKISSYSVLMRPQQYLKNVFIFLPLFFGGMITHADLLAGCALAFISFCLIASSVYVFNDYHDAEDDRKHPAKQLRPIAAGTVSRTEALVLALGLVALGLVSSTVSGKAFFYLALLYIFINLLYTLKIKHIAILDVFCIAVGFDIRLFAGSLVSGIELSLWIIIMTFLFALFIAFAKRRDDLVIYLRGGGKMRKSIEGYNMELLNAAMMIMASVIIVCYIMYTISPEVVHRGQMNHIYFTTAFVIIGVLRYLQITFVEEKSGSPTRALLHDRFLQLTVAGWIFAFWIILYS